MLCLPNSLGEHLPELISCKSDATVTNVCIINIVSSEQLLLRLSTAYSAALLFSKSNKTLFGHFDPETILVDNENKELRCDLTDVSAKK